MRRLAQRLLVSALAAAVSPLAGCADDAGSSETGLFVVLDDGAAALRAPDDFDAFGLQIASDRAVHLGLREPLPDGATLPQSLELLAGPVRGAVTVRALLYRGAATVATGTADAELVEGQMRRVVVVLATGVARLCEDGDGDGYGSGSGCLGPDCDDAADGTSPGAEEICGNGADDDCDGAMDEGCPCEDGASRACGQRNGGVGECRGGVQTCDGGLWAACEGGVSPTLEACNALDDDCDGFTDEGYDLASDPEHCGQCHHACEPGQVCYEHTCRDGGCPSGREACGGRCVDTDSDLLHCGRCDRPCPSGADCVAGECLCPAGQEVCRNRCVDTDADAQHCGRCDHACEGELRCVAGACGCGEGLRECGARCVDTDSDPAHCGDCDDPCAAGEVCYGGVCGQGCPPGRVACGGVCVDTTADEAHCGDCDRPCPQGAVCQKSRCVCPAGLTECGGACVDTTSDDRHCGRCDDPCTGGRECRSSRCLCPAGLDDCGVCVDTSSSNDHCGFCDWSCGPERVCVGSVCDCAGGLADCGGACVDTTADPAHCGGCDDPCDPGQTCEGSLCRCAGGLTACGDACVDMDTSLQHCGGCDRPCAPENATGAFCDGGACDFAACSGDYRDVNGDRRDGCEYFCDPAAAGAEICGDGEDNDCDGSLICDGGSEDGDGDEYASQASGGTDCDDALASVHPGAREVCGDGRDQDCDGTLICDGGSVDGDGDEYGSQASGGTDCDDTRADAHPGGDEVCNDGVDQDCDGGDLVCPDGMLLIPAGDFTRGSTDAEADQDESPVTTVSLDAYYIDKFPVTNQDYEACVGDGGCTAPSSSQSFTRSEYYGNPTYARYPVIFVSWSQARGFCRWAGKRLLSEAEWERAARGPGAVSRRYPWGDDDPSCTRANYGTGDAGQPCVGDTSAVDAHPAGATPEGVWDLGGNVYEWVHDNYSASYYDAATADNPLGPAAYDAGTGRGRRGGAFEDWSEARYLRGANRGYLAPADQVQYLGFRCARSPDDVDHDQDGYTTAQGDCADGDPASYPFAGEVCGDGWDNNCDGEIDEGC